MSLLQCQGLKPCHIPAPACFCLWLWLCGPLLCMKPPCCFQPTYCLWGLRVSCVSPGGHRSTSWLAAQHRWLAIWPAGAPGRAVLWSSLTVTVACASKPHSLSSAVCTFPAYSQCHEHRLQSRPLLSPRAELGDEGPPRPISPSPPPLGKLFWRLVTLSLPPSFSLPLYGSFRCGDQA